MKKVRRRKYCRCEYLYDHPYIHCGFDLPIIIKMDKKGRSFTVQPKDLDSCKKLRQGMEA